MQICIDDNVGRIQPTLENGGVALGRAFHSHTCNMPVVAFFTGIASLEEITDTNNFCITSKCRKDKSGLGFQVTRSVYVKARSTINSKIRFSINGIPNIFTT